MQFELAFPWNEWHIRTSVGKHSLRAKIDTGSSLTLIGINYAEEFGLTKDFILQQTCVSFRGVSGAVEGHAFKVPWTLLPIGSHDLSISFIYVPFVTSIKTIESKAERSIKFITPTKYLIGTDVLNNYQMRTSFNKDKNGKLEAVQFELLQHDCELPASTAKEYTLAQLYAKIDELLVED